MNTHKTLDHPWMVRFRAEPDEALDRLFSETAFLPGFERAKPSDALKSLFGPRSAETTSLYAQLDVALVQWLQTRRRKTLEQRHVYGLHSFITEYSEGLATIWRMELPESGHWLRENLLDLMHWARPLRISHVWNLPHQLVRAGALVQKADDGFYFFWLRLCREAADPSLDFLLEPALNGLARQKGDHRKQQMQQILLGLACWGENLAGAEDKKRFLQQWLSIKGRFSHTDRFWRDIWNTLLNTPRAKDAPYRQWLIERENGLEERLKTKSQSTIKLPYDVKGTVKKFRRRAETGGVQRPIIKEMLQLLRQLEIYAEQTGDSDLFMMASCSLGVAIVREAPGHALMWARKALCWCPNNEYAWDLRGRALYQLERVDLAEWVYWEAVRRCPGDPASRLQLSRLLWERGALDEAVQLLREGLELHPQNGPTRAELARSLAHTGQRSEAIERLSEIPPEKHGFCTYTLGLLRIAEGDTPKAQAVLEAYRQAFGNNFYAKTLSRLIQTGAKGKEEAIGRLTDSQSGFQFELRGQTHDTLQEEEQRLQYEELSQEEKTATDLRAVGKVTCADFLLRHGGSAQQEGAKKIIEACLQDDDDDLLAWVVGALNIPSLREQLRHRAQDDFPGDLAVQLAVASKQTTAAVWDDLGFKDPKAQHLIDLIRIVRVQDDDQAARQRLSQWLHHQPEKEESYHTFLKRHAHPVLEPMEGKNSSNCQTRLGFVLHDAIKQHVKVSDALTLAA